jgi:hypothetical protein
MVPLTPDQHRSLISALLVVAVVVLNPLPAFSEEESSSFAENAEDFSSIAQNDFPQLAQTPEGSVSPQALTHTPSGQLGNPDPNRENMTWDQYVTRLNELRASYEKGEISTRKFNRKVKKLKRRWRKSEEKRGHGFYDSSFQDHRPIETREIQIEKGQIRIEGSSQENP